MDEYHLNKFGYVPTYWGEHEEDKESHDEQYEDDD